MRSVTEWHGRTDDTPIPERVKHRILDRQNNCCDECGKPFSALRKPDFDHRPALINGGENRESKIFVVCRPCHKGRTKKDVAEKSKVREIKAKHLGFHAPKRKLQSRNSFRWEPGNVRQIHGDLE